MAEGRSKNLSTPEDTIDFPKMHGDVIHLGDLTVANVVTEPGWRWSTHVRPEVGGEWCQARHVGVILSGRLGVLFQDGTTREFGPNDVFEIPPGHDGYTVGHEPCENIEWAGLSTFLRGRFSASRTLVTLLFTDLVGSTALASELGDAAWRSRLSEHFEGARARLERFRGREVKTTGDGMLATFDAPAEAVHCAAAISQAASREELEIRAAVHVGEVEMVGSDVRGVAVHEAARIMDQARAGEILVSDTTRMLATASGLTFEERGTHELRGLPGDWPLYAYVPGNGGGST